MPQLCEAFTVKYIYNSNFFLSMTYRILCHPLKDDLPTSYLRPILDPHSQKMNGWNDEQFLNTRAVRFNMEGMYCSHKFSLCGEVN